MSRLVRRRPIFAYIRDFFNIGDWYLWISEDLEKREWHTKRLGSPVAFVSHSLSLIAQANTRRSEGPEDNQLDGYSGPGWLNYIATLIIYCLATISTLNMFYTFSRKRHYRMFESSIDNTPNTPSASRVKLNSSPISPSPLRSFVNIFLDQSANSQVQPHAMHDVWEISLWDPLPICLRFFCLFSPGHILVYWLLLPTGEWDPHPNLTAFKTIGLQIFMSAQLYLLQINFFQQSKDFAVIHREVVNEYDTKFVHPRLNPLVRDVATQYCKLEKGETSENQESLITYTPNFIIKRDFRTNPNLNYSSYFNPDGKSSSPAQAQTSPELELKDRQQDLSRSLTKSIHTLKFTPRKLNMRRTMVNEATTSKRSEGGSLGVYSHANSPLRKAASLQNIQPRDRETPKNSFDMASREVWEQRSKSRSPEKRLGEILRAPSNACNLLDDTLGMQNKMKTSSTRRSKHRPGPEKLLGRNHPNLFN